MNASEVSVGILTGGKSSRMGTNKALVPLGGKRMIEYVVETAREISSDVFLLTNTPDDYTFLQLPTHPDEISGIGPLGGIYTALIKSRFTKCFIIACDLPFVTEDLLHFMDDNLDRYDALVLDIGAGAEPLCALYTRQCLPAIEKKIAQNDFKATAFLAIVNARIIEPHEAKLFAFAGMFRNINTPEELQKAQKQMQGK